MSLLYDGTDVHLHEYIDSNFAGNVDSRKSTIGYVFTLDNRAVSWVSRLQKVVALSTTEAEYIVVTKACKKLIWMRNFMKELGKKQVTFSLHNDI